jgi:hypothetical protein
LKNTPIQDLEQALVDTAQQHGYTIAIRQTSLEAVKIRFPHVNATFDRFPHCSVSPNARATWGIVLAHYWVRGYSLSATDDGYVKLSRAPHHPARDGRPLHDPSTYAEKVFSFFEFENLVALHQAMTQWVDQVESRK